MQVLGHVSSPPAQSCIDGPFPSPKNLFGSLTGVSQLERVAKLFDEFVEAREKNGWETAVTDKQLGKFIVETIWPESLNASVKNDLLYTPSNSQRRENPRTEGIGGEESANV